MADYKLQFIQETEIELNKVLDRDSRVKAVDTITKTLDDYEVTKSSGDLVPYQGTNEALLKRYCACLLIEGKSQNTVIQYKRTAEHLAKTVMKTYIEMSVYDIRYFLACERQRGVSNRTLENTRAYLSAFFQWLFKEELSPKNPCMNIAPIKYVDKVKLPFSPVEIDALRSSCESKKTRAIFELLLASGIRVSELCALRICDVDFDNKTVHVTEGKGGKERIVYINDLAVSRLKSYLLERSETGDYLFYTEKHTPLKVGGVRYILNVIAERAEVDNVHPHRFRRTFATGLASRGMGVQEIQKLLGHTNINTTMEYVYISDEQVKLSYQKYIS